MPIIPELIADLDKIKTIHKSKNDDYATEDNPFFNFDVQEYVMNLFNNPRDKVFASLIGLKLARLANLLNKKTEPNNESIEDTFIDKATYTLIWKTDWMRRKEKLRRERASGDSK